MKSDEIKCLSIKVYIYNGTPSFHSERIFTPPPPSPLPPPLHLNPVWTEPFPSRVFPCLPQPCEIQAFIAFKNKSGSTQRTFRDFWMLYTFYVKGVSITTGTTDKERSYIEPRSCTWEVWKISSGTLASGKREREPENERTTQLARQPGKDWRLLPGCWLVPSQPQEEGELHSLEE